MTAVEPAVDIGVLGALRLEVGDGTADVPGRRKRAVISALAAQPGRPWSASELIDAVWGQEPPPSGRKALQVHMSELRRHLRECGAGGLAAAIQTSRQGYLLDVDPGVVDAHRFTRLLARAEAETQETNSAALLTEALALWRGEPYPDLVETSSLRPEVERLATLRLAAEELRVSVVLRTGVEPAILAEAEAMVSERPLRERRTVLLMAALLASGRQAEALAAFRRTADRLRDELGLEPGAELAAAELAVLHHDRAALGIPLDDESTRPSASGRSAADAHRGRPSVEEVSNDVVAAVVVLGPRATVASVGALIEVGGRELLEAIDHAIAAGRVDRSGQHLGLPPGPTDRPTQTIPTAVQAELHQRAATHLVAHPIPDPADHAAELARHRLGALPIGSTTDAVVACRAAGDARSRSDPARAAEFYGQARSLVIQSPEPERPALARSAIRLAIAEAECLVRSGGSDDDVRALTIQAADLAVAAGDGELLAEAVLVQTQLRSAAIGIDTDLARRQQDAISLLGPDPSSLRVRLLADRAASLVLSDAVDERSHLARLAVADARALDDSFTLSEALTGLHQAEWRPGNTRDRLAWAQEARANADESGSPTQRIHTRLYLVNDHLELGNLPEALIALGGAEGMAATAGSARYRWATTAWRALLELVGGRFDRAAELGDAALAHWADKPNPDAVTCRIGQSITSDLVQGQHRRISEVLAGLVGQNLDLIVLRAMLAYALAAAGDTEAARRQLDALGPDPAERIPDDPGRALGLAMLLEAACLLDPLPHWVDGAAAGLEPVVDHHIVINLFGGGGFYWGVPSHQLGLVAARRGDLASARRWLARAEAAHAKLGAEPWQARSGRALARIAADA